MQYQVNDYPDLFLADAADFVALANNIKDFINSADSEFGTRVITMFASDGHVDGDYFRQRCKIYLQPVQMPLSLIKALRQRTGRAEQPIRLRGYIHPDKDFYVVEMFMVINIEHQTDYTNF